MAIFNQSNIDYMNLLVHWKDNRFWSPITNEDLGSKIKCGGHSFRTLPEYQGRGNVHFCVHCKCAYIIQKDSNNNDKYIEIDFRDYVNYRKSLVNFE